LVAECGNNVLRVGDYKLERVLVASGTFWI
jgi:hypothetical protein